MLQGFGAAGTIAVPIANYVGIGLTAYFGLSLVWYTEDFLREFVSAETVKDMLKS
jgi:hypothetical protein